MKVIISSLKLEKVKEKKTYPNKYFSLAEKLNIYCLHVQVVYYQGRTEESKRGGGEY